MTNGVVRVLVGNVGARRSMPLVREGLEHVDTRCILEVRNLGPQDTRFVGSKIGKRFSVCSLKQARLQAGRIEVLLEGTVGLEIQKRPAHLLDVSVLDPLAASKEEQKELLTELGIKNVPGRPKFVRQRILGPFQGNVGFLTLQERKEEKNGRKKK